MVREGRFTARIDTVVIIVTGRTRQHSRIDTMIEDTAETERGCTMADTTIDGAHVWVAHLWPGRICAIVTACAVIRDIAVIRIGIFKAVDSVTERTIVIRFGWGIDYVIGTDGRFAVVAHRTSTGNTRVIVFAIRI